MTEPSLLKTPLFASHQALGGRMVEFGGWEMPLLYSSIFEEHRAVRERVGLFEISHMGRLFFSGPNTRDWLERVTTNRVASLAENQIQYSLMANASGGIIDDLLVYRSPRGYLVVCNASNRPAVLGQLERYRPDYQSEVTDKTLDTAMLAVQGPAAQATLEPLFDQPLEGLKSYHLRLGRLVGDAEAVVSRTGYTGEDGFELIVGAGDAERVWDALLESGRTHGILPCGLGARDTLRFEAAMPLYGHELSESIDPFEAGLGWAVKLGKGDFVGREALVSRRQQQRRKRVGLRLEGKRIARQGSAVQASGAVVGTVTSGTFAPTVGASLAMALVDTAVAAVGTPLQLDVRGHLEPCRVVELPFYRRAAQNL